MLIFGLLAPVYTVHVVGTQNIAVNEGMRKGMRQNKRNSASLLKSCGEAPSTASFLLCLSKVWAIPLYVYALSAAKRAS